jgi:hypothetical protein
MNPMRGLAAASAAAALLLAGCSGGSDHAAPPPPPPTATQPASKLTLADRLANCELADQAAARACYQRTLAAVVVPARDPRKLIDRITAIAWSDPGGFLLGNCHVLMHPVGRAYAKRHHVTLASMMNVLPLSNDPSCPAGFSHGLIIGVAPQIDLSDPGSSAAACDRAKTRYERYSCVHGFGHAFMRLAREQLHPALALCERLGPAKAGDCAGGAFHDYWLAVEGYDNAKAPSAHPETDPRKLCAAQAAAFVAACWYRSFLESRPPGYQTDSADSMSRLCTGLRGAQRDGCITAASVIGPPDPVDQLALCAQFGKAADALSCVRGTKVQNLLRYPVSTYVDVIRRCELLRGTARLDCYEWLGKTISVVTDGRFARTGCSKLSGPARTACMRGARSMNGPLVTFS